MIPLKFKLIAGGVVLLALGFAVIWLNTRLERANEADALQQKYDGLVQSVAQRDKQQLEQLAQDMDAATVAIEAIERGQAALAALAQQPVKTVVYRETKSPDGSTCAQPSISADWVRNYNATAAAATPAR